MTINRTALVGMCLVCCGGAFAIQLTKNGKSDWTIVLAADATAPEKTAASELQDYLQQITGASLPIRPETDVGENVPQILVGPSDRLKKTSPKIDWTALGQDGIVIKTVGNKLLLAGGRPRGTLYAVYTFLEDNLGCRWWLSSESFVPREPSLKIPNLDLTYVPKLRYREAYYQDTIKSNYQFATRLKLNGHMVHTPGELGGHYEIIGWCHTFYELLPPSKYFKQHPEWYSLINGKRDTTNAQLCLTNEEMRKELVRVALKKIRKNPGAGIISISQNDCIGNCQCEKCRAIDKEEGSPSGSLIRFVNEVATDIAKDYPNFLIETLAYEYTRHPPKHVKPAKNVLVRLCCIEADFCRPLSSDANKSFGDDLRGWSAIAPNLFIWNYVTNFSDFWLPHPNIRPLGDDLRFFAANNVVGVFEQGDAYNACTGDFTALRAWLLAHLMWDASRDQKQLTNIFLEGYYGAAAPYLREYLDLVAAGAERKEFHLHTFNGDLSFFPPDAMNKAIELFDRAAKAVADDPVRSRRVRRERLVLDRVRLMRYDVNKRVAEFKKSGAALDPRAVCAEYDAAVEDFLRTARKSGASHLSEGQSFDVLESSLRGRCENAIPPELPPAGAKLAEGSFDFQEDQFKLAGVGEWASIVDDPKASNGKAVRMPGGHGQWAVQLHANQHPELAGKGTFKCWAVVRCVAKQKSGAAFSCGLFAPGGERARNNVLLESIADDDYHPYLIAAADLKAGEYLWIAPPGRADLVDAIYVDRIYITRDVNKR